MSRSDRSELERLVQSLERKHPDWAASRIESELRDLSAVAYGNWKDDTPELRSRLRQIQRWRRGESGAGRKPAGPLPFRYLWPVGERQRQGLEPNFVARATSHRASHRLFLHNHSREVLREIHASLGGREVAYEPALAPNRTMELHWVRNEEIRARALEAAGDAQVTHPLRVTFAVANGTRSSRLEGRMEMNATYGWTGFTSDDGTSKEIE